MFNLVLLSRSPLFDPDWYGAHNPGIGPTKYQALLHYYRYGGFEGRDPGPMFSSNWYLNTYEDVKRTGINPLVHYLRTGRGEGRKTQGSVAPSPSLQTQYFDDDAERYFCISMQRTGTTSVGKFFRDYGFQWAGWPQDAKNDWSGYWYEGDYEKIFASPDFRAANAFEDSPWFLPGFYKILFWRFPKSKFILFTRNADTWFQSMVRHSGGNVLGRSKIHSKVYRRELEYFDLVNSGAMNEIIENDRQSEKTMKLFGLAEHYKDIYRLHTLEVQEFFQRHCPEALHVGTLEDPEKWVKLGNFLDLDVPAHYESHENKSSVS